MAVGGGGLFTAVVAVICGGRSGIDALLTAFEPQLSS